MKTLNEMLEKQMNDETFEKNMKKCNRSLM